jgi:uncharacterized protein
MALEVDEKEVSWEVLGVRVRATVAAPRTARSTLGVVLVAGSGPTDRNWCSPLLPGVNGSAQLLSGEFGRRGIASIRYDKLGSGPTVREDLPKFSGRLSMQTHLDELSGAVQTLLRDQDAVRDNLFALANSEGAIHVVNYQLQSPTNRFRGLILTGCPGRSIGSDARSQLAEQGKALPNLPDLLKLYDEAIARFLAGKPANPDPALPEGVRRVIQSLEFAANLPFARELWTYNLSEHIAGVSDPVLVVIGKKDLQIDWKVDGSALERATKGKSNVSFSYPESANHVLKHEERPREELTGATVGQRYNATDTELDADTLTTILAWIESHSRPPSI